MSDHTAKATALRWASTVASYRSGAMAVVDGDVVRSRSAPGPVVVLDLPAAVRSRIEGIIGGGAVTEAVSQRGGFSPGTADRVRTERGPRAFVKAVSPADMASSFSKP